MTFMDKNPGLYRNIIRSKVVLCYFFWRVYVRQVYRYNYQEWDLYRTWTWPLPALMSSVSSIFDIAPSLGGLPFRSDCVSGLGRSNLSSAALSLLPSPWPFPSYSSGIPFTSSSKSVVVSFMEAASALSASDREASRWFIFAASSRYCPWSLSENVSRNVSFHSSASMLQLCSDVRGSPSFESRLSDCMSVVWIASSWALYSKAFKSAPVKCSNSFAMPVNSTSLLRVIFLAKACRISTLSSCKLKCK